MSQKTKQIIFAVVIIIVAFVGFKMFFAPDPSLEAITAELPNANEQFVDGQAILALLTRLNKVTLNPSIFSDPVFNGLVSFEKPIPDQAAGRSNPFAPIGADGSSVLVKPTSTSTTTN